MSNKSFPNYRENADTEIVVARVWKIARIQESNATSLAKIALSLQQPETAGPHSCF